MWCEGQHKVAENFSRHVTAHGLQALSSTAPYSQRWSCDLTSQQPLFCNVKPCIWMQARTPVVTWWGRMRSDIFKFYPSEPRNKHVRNMKSCIHRILYYAATTYGYCHRIHISPTVTKLINHSKQRNHHYFSRNSPFIRRSEDKPTIKTYQLSKTLRVLQITFAEYKK